MISLDHTPNKHAWEMFVEWTNEGAWIIIWVRLLGVLSVTKARHRRWHSSFFPTPSRAPTELCFAHHRSCLKHRKSSRGVRSTSFSSGHRSKLRTTSHQLPTQSCFSPPKNRAGCTWRGGCPRWQTSRSCKSNLVSGVHWLEKCWQRMYYVQEGPLPWVTCTACAEPL